MVKFSITLFLFFFGGLVGAFDLASCEDELRSAPYNMPASEAAAVCEAKNADSGSGEIGAYEGDYVLGENQITAKHFGGHLANYLGAGKLVVATCSGSCPNSNNMPDCPDGYSLVNETAGKLHTSGIVVSSSRTVPIAPATIIRSYMRGSQRTRSALCLKN